MWSPATTSAWTWRTNRASSHRSPRCSPSTTCPSTPCASRARTARLRSSSSPTARRTPRSRRPCPACGNSTPYAASPASCVWKGSRPAMNGTIDQPRMSGTHQWRGIIEEYRDRLPVAPDSPVVTLLEGGTPLVPAQLLSERTGCDVYLKVEGANPTGSFKDRGMTMAISKAKEAGAQAVICASTGNTSASAAAYAVRAGMVCAVLVPQGKIALGKMGQALVHGSRILQVDGNFDDCLDLARGLSEKYPVALVNSVNPVRIEGQKTASFEIVDMLGDAPDIHVLPVGNAGNITAYWKGYREYAADGLATRTPRMWGFQAAGSAPIVDGAPVRSPQTIATAIRIGNPASWEYAIAA